MRCHYILVAGLNRFNTATWVLGYRQAFCPPGGDICAALLHCSAMSHQVNF